MRSRRWVVLILVLAALLGWEAWRTLTHASAVRDGAAIVVVPANQGVLDVANQLRDTGIIRSPEGFVALSLARGSYRTLKAGEYEVPQHASTPAVLALIESGKVRQHPILHRE